MYERQEGLVNSTALKDLQVTVVGVGGIGSYAVMSLAKMGVGQITVIDNDRVEELNIPSQIYRLCDVGKPKVIACLELIKEATGREIRISPMAYNKQTDKIIVATVDSMEVRKQIFKTRGKSNLLFIDGRMAAEIGRVLTVKDKETAKLYRKTLYSDEEAEDMPCSSRAIVYNTAILANIIVSQIKKFVAGEELASDILLDLKNYIFA